MSTLGRRSALAHRSALSAANGAVTVKERPFEGKLILRGSPERIGAPVASVLGSRLPAEAHGTSTGARGTAQWLGPDEWLLVTAPGAEAALANDLQQALAGIPAQIADVTDYYTTIELSGSRAREMLMKITTIDLHPRAFKKGMGVTSNFGRATPWVRQTGDDAEAGGPAFDIVIRISMADYMWCLLAESGHEWGLPELEPKGAKVHLHLPHLEPASS